MSCPPLDHQFVRRTALSALVALSLGGCNALLGIEDLLVRSDAGAEASSDASVTRPLDDMTNPIAATDAGTKPRDAGGAPPKGVMNSAGAAAMPPSDTGKPAATSGTALRGTLIDEVRQPIAGAELMIGGQRATTDAMGRFSFDNVVATYDATITLRKSNGSGQMCTSVWHFEGVTRREPRFQCVGGPHNREANLHVSTRSPSFPLPDGTELKLALGSEKAVLSWTWIKDVEYDLFALWSGEASVADVAAHALLMRITDGQAHYLGHQASSLELNVTGSKLELDVTEAALPEFEIKGHVTAPGRRARSNYIWLRWAKDARMNILKAANDDFLYRVPEIDGASVSVLAYEGEYEAPPVTIAWVDNIVGPGPDLKLVIPNAPMLSQPEPMQTGVDANTHFQWSDAAGVVRLEVAAVEGCDHLYVVTKNTEVTLPVSPHGDYTLPRGAAFTWQLTTRDFRNVDEALDVSGYESPFVYGMKYGSERVTGTFAMSAAREFKTAE